jgi:hypothetical protein
VFELIFLPEARAAYEGLDSDDQAEIDSIIYLFELNPRSDDIAKFTVTLNTT